MAQHIGLTRWAECLQVFDAWRVAGVLQVLLGQFVQQALRLRRMPCTAGQGLAKRRKGCFKGGQQLVADFVAREAGVGVAGVFHPGHAQTLQPFTQNRTGHGQPRPVQHQAMALDALGHGRQTRQPCPTR